MFFKRTTLLCLLGLLPVATLAQTENQSRCREISVRISEGKILIPDVIASRTIQEPYPTEPVLLCCEILSPEDRLGSTLAKCDEYHAWGVPFCWVIDPVKRSAWEYHASGELIHATGTLQAGEIAVSLTELFSALDQ